MGDFTWAKFETGILSDEFNNIRDWQTSDIVDCPFGVLNISKDGIVHNLDFMGTKSESKITFTGTAYFIGMDYRNNFQEIAVIFEKSKVVSFERLENL
jgi:hypothetical protein